MADPHTRKVAVAGIVFAALASCLSCNSSSPAAPPPPVPVTCSYQVTASADPLPAEGGRLTLTIATGATCGWRVRPGVDWIAVESGETGTGTGTSILNIHSNDATVSREALVAIEDQSVRVTQRGRTCSYTIAPEGTRFGADGGRGTFTLSTTESCAWTAMSTESWLTIEPTTGVGSFDIQYVATSNPAETDREAAIMIGDRRFTVSQDGVRRTCEFSVSPVDITLHWHGYTGPEVTVGTGAGCGWTVRSTADWLTIIGAEQRSGPDVFRFAVGNFTEDATRRAPIEVRWDTPTAGQNVWVAQEGCRYGMESAKTFPAQGGTGFTTVVTQAISPSCSIGCPWTATSDSPWIRITWSMPRAGDDAFGYVVDPNPGPAPRTGRITVANLTLVITQSN